MIDPATAVGIGQWPALGVNHLAELVLARLDVPQFLDAEAVDLRLDVLVEVEQADQLLRQMAADALGEKRIFGT